MSEKPEVDAKMFDVLKKRIKEFNAEEKRLEEALKYRYKTWIDACMTTADVSKCMGEILEELELEWSDQLPGTFAIEFFYANDRCRQLEKTDE